MKISIVTVSYNSGRTIGDTLASVAMQAHPEVEHIVIDGGSTDNTLDIVRERGVHVSRVLSEPDRGIYDAMNKGLRLASGDFVGFLNSDDVYVDDLVLADIADAVRLAGESCQYVYGDICMIDDHGQVVREWQTGELAAGPLDGRQIPHPAFFARREALDLIKPAFDSTLRIAADLKQQLILINKMGARGCYVPRALVKMRLGGTSTRSFRAYVDGWCESVRAYNDVFGSGGLWFTVSKVLSKLGGVRRLHRSPLTAKPRFGSDSRAP